MLCGGGLLGAFDSVVRLSAAPSCNSTPAVASDCSVRQRPVAVRSRISSFFAPAFLCRGRIGGLVLRFLSRSFPLSLSRVFSSGYLQPWLFTDAQVAGRTRSDPGPLTSQIVRLHRNFDPRYVTPAGIVQTGSVCRPGLALADFGRDGRHRRPPPHASYAMISLVIPTDDTVTDTDMIPMTMIPISLPIPTDDTVIPMIPTVPVARAVSLASVRRQVSCDLLGGGCFNYGPHPFQRLPRFGFVHSVLSVCRLSGMVPTVLGSMFVPFFPPPPCMVLQHASPEWTLHDPSSKLVMPMGEPVSWGGGNWWGPQPNLHRFRISPRFRPLYLF